MVKQKEYAFVIDNEGKQLSPTPVGNAWFLIRKNRAILKSKYPMIIQLLKIIKNEDIDTSTIVCGIDDGSKYVGLALVQKCKTKNKVIFKGQIEHRQDVKKLMTIRHGYRSYRKYHKRYRAKRFYNRASYKRQGRLAPSIKQKRQSILRVIKQLKKWINIHHFYLEDVAIDIRVLTDGYKPYKWEYQQSNRLDENIRKAIILRDGCKCMQCKKKNTVLEVHHIKAKRYKGSNSLKNLITLCTECHDKIKGIEEQFETYFYSLINGMNIRFDYAQHVMQGKTYLRTELNYLGNLFLTNGGETSNKRIDWKIEKTHSNDAICITGLKPNTTNIKEWLIKPIRRKSKAKTDNVMGIKHKDLVSYTYKNGETHVGYVTALYPDLKALNFQSKTKHCKKVNASKCQFIWRYNKIYWLDCV